MKAGICITLFLVGIVLAANEGGWFPWVNLIGFGAFTACAWLSNLWARDLGRRLTQIDTDKGG